MTPGEAVTTHRPWYPDALGPDWVASDLPLAGGAIATLVGRASRAGVEPGSGRPAVLYVHGFCDYFFQRHVADAFEERGYPFYAIDLRGYGRSIGRGSGAPARADDDPNFVTDLSVYAHDLDAARAAIRAEGHDRLVVVAHSTGGLIASLWANARPGALDALVLNSPWFDLNSTWFDRVVSSTVIDAVGGLVPRLKVAALGGDWGRALHVSTGGPWDYDLEWKPLDGFPVRAGWLRTVRRSHRRVARGLDIGCPVLVLTSDRSGPHDRWHPELLSTDSVLDVEQIRRRAPRLGVDVTLDTIPGGAHDLALSAGPARDDYLSRALGWLDEETGITEKGLPPSGH